MSCAVRNGRCRRSADTGERPSAAGNAAVAVNPASRTLCNFETVCQAPWVPEESEMVG